MAEMEVKGALLTLITKTCHLCDSRSLSRQNYAFHIFLGHTWGSYGKTQLTINWSVPSSEPFFFLSGNRLLTSDFQPEPQIRECRDRRTDPLIHPGKSLPVSQQQHVPNHLESPVTGEITPTQQGQPPHKKVWKGLKTSDARPLTLCTNCSTRVCRPHTSNLTVTSLYEHMMGSCVSLQPS